MKETDLTTRALRRPLAARMLATAVLATLISGSGAQAGPLLFSLNTPDQSVSWIMPDSPTPDRFYSGSNFHLDAQLTDAAGQPLASGISLTFYNSDPPSLGLLGYQYSSAKLYSGSEEHPLFQTGITPIQRVVYAEFILNSPGIWLPLGAPGTLTISDAPAAPGAPGAPGPEIGLGLAPAAAALAGLLLTRVRRRKAIA